jgi:signal transduction histidine kinase
VALVFSQEGKQINISYSDNGVGAEPKIIENGNGIKNLKDRLKTIKGKAIFETADKGVKAEFYIPFNF